MNNKDDVCVLKNAMLAKYSSFIKTILADRYNRLVKEFISDMDKEINDAANRACVQIGERLGEIVDLQKDGLTGETEITINLGIIEDIVSESQEKK